MQKFRELELETTLEVGDGVRSATLMNVTGATAGGVRQVHVGLGIVVVGAIALKCSKPVVKIGGCVAVVSGGVTFVHGAVNEIRHAMSS